ncbi:1-phosphofructokinase [Desulfofundulus sp.]|uniref:1-phosphofructokinase n=1 Tax=Desulfofundulus sp. TaxID=2282750 RepID=UPI003C74A256
MKVLTGMIATVTLNPALDKTVVVPDFTIGRTNRVQVNYVDAGGKGINVAKVLKQLGSPVIATGFLAGNNGRYISEALSSRDILTDFLYIGGETRVNLKIIDSVSGTETEINEPGFLIAGEHLEQFEQKTKELAKRCPVMVFSGSLPPGAPPDTYAVLIRIARECGTRTILDTSGEALEVGLAAGPDLVKPNLAEVQELLQIRIEAEKDLVGAARRLLEMGAGTAVISLGAAGAVAASGNRVIRARPPSVRASSTVGAGDSMVAAFAYAMMKDLSLDEALRLATAASTATVTVRGSGVGDLRLIQEFLSQVVLEELQMH